jgi:hypothetical protein
MTSRFKWVFLSAAVIGLCTATGFIAFRARERLTRTFPLVAPVEKMPESRNQFQLSTQSLPESIRAHLLDGDFQIVTRMSDIPEGCGSPLAASFVTTSGRQMELGAMNFADPGEPFQESDHIRPGLPFRRLQFAGVGAANCFVQYQNGGKMYPSFCLAVVDQTTHKTIWVGESEKSASDLNELRLMLRGGKFNDRPGPGC